MNKKRNPRRAAARVELRAWGNLKREQDEKREQIREIDERLSALYDLHPQNLSGMPHGSTAGDPTAEAAHRNRQTIQSEESRKALLEAGIAELEQAMMRTTLIVAQLPPLECEVIKLRYLRFGVSTKGFWPKIARRMCVSTDYAKQLERQGVDRFAKLKAKEKKKANDSLPQSRLS